MESTAYHRVSAAWLLRGHGVRVQVRPGVVVVGEAGARRRGVRRRKHGLDVAKVLTKVWEMTDYICGRRLAAVLVEVVPRLVELGEVEATPALLVTYTNFVRGPSLWISPAVGTSSSWWATT